VLISQLGVQQSYPPFIWLTRSAPACKNC